MMRKSFLRKREKHVEWFLLESLTKIVFKNKASVSGRWLLLSTLRITGLSFPSHDWWGELLLLAVRLVLQDYKVSMYLRQAWRDPRLAFPALRNKVVKVNLGAGTWSKIWIPDTFLRNEKGAKFHRVTVENRMLKLEAPGDLWYVVK